MHEKKIRELRERLQKLQKELSFLKRRYESIINKEVEREIKTAKPLPLSPINEIEKQGKIKRHRIINLRKRINQINEEMKDIEHNITIIKGDIKCDFCGKDIKHTRDLVLDKKRTYCESCWHKLREKSKKQGLLRQIWNFLKADTWQSWLVSIVLIIIFIKFVFFPVLSFFTGSSLPLVVIESCSMYHESDFEEWWYKNSEWYESREIAKSEFLSFPHKNGLNKGDIILVIGKEEYNAGDIIIFNAAARHPLIHRLISQSPYSTKGDHNSNQLNLEKDIQKDAIIGKAALRIPVLGWIKLVFFEPFRQASERGLCQ